MTDYMGPIGLALSIAVAGVAVGLGLSLRRERRGRTAYLSDDDHRYFARQDKTRGIGVAILWLLAIGVQTGSSMRPRNLPTAFVFIWLINFGLILVLLALAFSDWRAIRQYARRHR